jgi:hypothetical protein
MKLLKKYWMLIVIADLIFSFIHPALPCLLMGTLFLLMSIAGLKVQQSIFKKGISAIGKIKWFRAGLWSTAPTIEFTTANGIIIANEPVLYTSTDLSGFESKNKLIDKEVLVFYDPSDPDEFLIANNRTSNMITLMLFGIAGAVFIAVGIAGLSGYIKIN